jgi:hypothetical protein
MSEDTPRFGQWVVRKSARGFDDSVWVWADTDVARTNEWFLRSCLYLYGSEDAARSGEKAGGSACLVSVQSESRPFGLPPHLYAVTNKHVVEKDKCTFLRYNIMSEGFDVKATARGWLYSKKDDLAACPITFPDWGWYFPISLEHFVVTEEKIKEYNIGIGDDVFMISRFIGHEGREENKPAVRFGNISVMPDPNDPVVTDEGKQEAYLVEMRSVGGASGSPVFWYVPGHVPQPDYKERRGVMIHPLLLGVDCGHFSDPAPVLDPQDKEHPHGWHIRSNSGMAVVIPVWRIRQLLNKRRFVVAREEEDERRANQGKLKEKRGRVVSDSKRPRTMPAQEITPEGFEGALEKVFPRPSQSASKKKRT